MKNFRIFILFAVFTILTAANVFAQSPTFSVKVSERTSSGFDVNSGDSLGTSIILLDKSYPLFITSSGSKYVKLTGKKGQYPLWVCEATNDEFLGLPVYRTTNGSRAILQTSKNSGNPYPVWLGNDTGYTHEDHDVRQSNSGNYYYLSIVNGRVKKTNLQAN